MATPRCRGCCRPIALREAGVSFDLVRVDIRTHKTDQVTTTPIRSIPRARCRSCNWTVVADCLREARSSASTSRIRPANRELMPAPGHHRALPGHGMAELHHLRGAQELFGTVQLRCRCGLKDTYRQPAAEEKYEWLNAKLEGKTFLTGSAFTAADAYLFVVTRWAKAVELDLSSLSALKAFMAAVEARPADAGRVGSEQPAGRSTEAR